MTKREAFWSGFATGAGSGIGALLTWNAFSARNRRILRLERGLQIGRPVGEVFKALTRLEQLPALSRHIGRVQTLGRRSRWVVNLEGKSFEWEAERVQFIPGQAIAWKSVRGPKHSGRVTFAPLENDTLVHVTMNYAPRWGIFSRALAPLREHLGGRIDQVLRDFKATLEGQEGSPVAHTEQATGTFGKPPEAAGVPQTQHARFGGVEQAAEYTRPTQPAPVSQPDAKR